MIFSNLELERWMCVVVTKKGEWMGKTIKFNLKHPVNQVKHDPEHHDEWALVNLRESKNHHRDPSTKSRVHMGGHFTKQHVWPLRNEAHKGRKV